MDTQNFKAMTDGATAAKREPGSDVGSRESRGEGESYMLLRHRDAFFGVAATAVEEIFHLPELTPLENVPDYVAGALNFRGRVVPIIDFDRRLGYAPERFNLADNVLVFREDAKTPFPFGLIVSEVMDVLVIAAEAIDPAPFRAHREGGLSGVVSHEARIGERIIMLLDHARLIDHDDALDPAPPAEDRPNEEGGRGAKRRRGARYLADATDEERGVLRRRTQSLMNVVDHGGFSELLPVSVLALGGELFGIPLEMVSEFTTIANVVPVPCCPAHVIGNVNLRGEILPLVDLRAALDMAQPPQRELHQVVVVNAGEFLAGVSVDAIHDVIYLRRGQLSPAPAALKEARADILLGVTAHKGEMLSILDARAILLNGGLIVDERV